MQQALITVYGYVGSDPQPLGASDGEASVCSFRVGSTRRYFSKRLQQWCDAPTTWMTVKAFRSLAGNVLRSLRKGDPVIVSGSLATEQWERDGAQHSRLVLEAQAVGHDLNRGVSTFAGVAAPSAAAGRGAAPSDGRATVFEYRVEESGAPSNGIAGESAMGAAGDEAV